MKKGALVELEQNPQNLRDAIVFLKQARLDMVSRLANGTLKAPDSTHLYACMALTLLTGESS